LSSWEQGANCLRFEVTDLRIEFVGAESRHRSEGSTCAVLNVFNVGGGLSVIEFVIFAD